MNANTPDKLPHQSITPVKVAFTQRGVLLDYILLQALADTDAALIMTYVLWVEWCTRYKGDQECLPTDEPWAPPRNLKAWKSHWFRFNYDNCIEMLGGAITQQRLASRMSWFVDKLGVLQRKRTPTVPSFLEYRLDYSQMAEYLPMPFPEDFESPVYKQFVLPKIHPQTGQLHPYYSKRAKVNAIAESQGRRGVY